MISKPSQDITLIVYDDQRNGRCFQFTKSQLRALIYSIPLFLFLATLTIFLLLTFTRKTVHLKYTPAVTTDIVSSNSQSDAEGSMLQELQRQKIELSQRNTELLSQNKELLQKITAGPQQQPFLPFFKSTLGFQNLTNKKMLELEKESVRFTTDKMILNFNMIKSEEVKEKITGHILVLLENASYLSFYPSNPLNMGDSIISFEAGEKFTMSRFRPVEAQFTGLGKIVGPSFFHIFIFAKSGDLLVQKKLGPFTNP